MSDEELLAAIEARDVVWQNTVFLERYPSVQDRRELLRMLKEARAERGEALEENKWLRLIVDDEFGDDMADVIIARRRERAANPEDEQ